MKKLSQFERILYKIRCFMIPLQTKVRTYISIFECNIQNDPTLTYHNPREQWHAYDPFLISEGLFGAGMISSYLKLVHIFSINPHLGPLQVIPFNIYYNEKVPATRALSGPPG